MKTQLGSSEKGLMASHSPGSDVEEPWRPEDRQFELNVQF